MHHSPQHPARSGGQARRRAHTLLAAAALSLCGLLTGCAALTNPTAADAIPVRRLPPELLGESRGDKQTIPLNLLGQQQPAEYRLAAGDVLAVYIENVLGERTQNPPVYFPAQISTAGRRLPPAVGFPVPVRADGTIALPMIEPIPVQGMTLEEVQQVVRETYVKKEILQEGRARIMITLMQPRQVHVTVMRQESSSLTVTPEGIGGAKRGVGYEIDLPAYQNDVLHALSQTGGLPGLDAYDEVIIERAVPLAPPGVPGAPAGPGPCPGLACAGPHGPGHPIVRIPLRARPGAPLGFGPADVLLYSGDVVFIEARDREVFYTGGLLPAGQFILPRDIDLDVVKAVAQVRGTLFNGAFGGSNLSGALIAPGLGNPSPSLLVVVREVPGHGQVSIRVDLRRAVKDPRERILVQPGDLLVLQETPGEAVARYVTETFLNFSLTWEVIHSQFATGVVDVAAPERIPSRIGVAVPGPSSAVAVPVSGGVATTP